VGRCRRPLTEAYFLNVERVQALFTVLSEPILLTEPHGEQRIFDVGRQAVPSKAPDQCRRFRHGFRSGWNLGQINLRNVNEIIQNADRTVDRRSARVL